MAHFANSLDGDRRLSSLPRVLIVDASAESREILRTLLERYGATTIEAQRPEQAVRLADRFRPDLILLDAESDRSATGAATAVLREAASRTDTPIVILGTLRNSGGRLPAGQFIAKPYHYGPLIRKINGLLAAA
jgi:DNA-binding response OmpR family regulator